VVVIWNNMFALLARVCALVLGGYLAYCEVTGTYEYYLADQGTFNYIVKATVGVTLTTALAPMFIMMAFRARQWALGGALLLALPLAILLVFGAAVSRTGGAADHAQVDRIAEARARDLAEKSEAESTLALKDARAEAVKECNTGNGTGRGHKCNEAEGKREDAQRRLDRARADLKNAKDPRKDPWAERIASITNGKISEEDVRLYWPVTVPLVVSIFAGLLLAFGTRMETTPHTPTASNPVAHKLGSRMRWRKREEQKEAIPDQVLEPHEILEPEIVEPKRSPFRRQQPQLRLVASNKNSMMHSIVDFIIEGLESGSGTSVSEKDAYKAYARACKAANAKPVTPEEFVPLLDKACRDCGIERVHKGGRVYLMDVRLVNPALAS
jgi:hypothetical protein